MKVSWFYKSEQEMVPDFTYLEDNKYFIWLANILHQHSGVTRDMKDLLDDINKSRKEEKECSNGSVSEETVEPLALVFGNISSEAIYSQDITDSTLEIAASLYFDMVRFACHRLHCH